MSELILKTIFEGLLLGALLVLVCAVGIRKGAVGLAITAAILSAVMTIFIH